MIRTWLADIRALYDEECYQKYFAALPAFRQEKAGKLLFQKDRAQREQSQIHSDSSVSHCPKETLN